MAQGVVRCTIKGTLSGREVANVLAVDYTQDLGGTVQERTQDIVDIVSTAWQTHILPRLSVGYIVTSVSGYDVGQPIQAAERGVNVAGGIAASDGVYAAAMAAKVKISTGLRGRAFQGRTGLPGLTESMVSGNGLTVTARQNLQDGVAAFRTALLGSTTPIVNTVRMGVLSVYQGVDADGKPIPRPGGPIFTPASTVTVEQLLGTRVGRLR